MSDAAIRIGVIGVGRLGSIHARLWSGVEGAELVGVLDTDAGRASAVAAEHGGEPFSDLDELLDGVQAVSLVTPTSTHAQIARRAIERGVHTFIEKPIAATYAEACELIDLAREKGVTIQVGHVERFNPAFAELRKNINEPMFIEAHRLAQFQPRATDVAVVLDLMIHDVDLVLTLVESPLRELRAGGAAVVSDSIDIANARLEFENGCVANLTASRISQRQMRKMRLFQRDAYLSVDFAAPALEIFRIEDDDGSAAAPATTLLGAIELGSRRRKISYQRPKLAEWNAIQEELRAFRRAVTGEAVPPVTGYEGADALRVAEEIVNTIEQGRRRAGGPDRGTAVPGSVPDNSSISE